MAGGKESYDRPNIGMIPLLLSQLCKRSEPLGLSVGTLNPVT
jgi:hypothetical protein